MAENIVVLKRRERTDLWVETTQQDSGAFTRRSILETIQFDADEQPTARQYKGLAFGSRKDGSKVQTLFDVLTPPGEAPVNIDEAFIAFAESFEMWKRRQAASQLIKASVEDMRRLTGQGLGRKEKKGGV